MTEVIVNALINYLNCNIIICIFVTNNWNGTWLFSHLFHRSI